MADPLETLLRECTVRVTGGPMPGAGFFVAPGKVLTCVHVIGDSAALVVRWERDSRPVLEVPVSGRAAVLADRGRPIPALDRDYPDVAVLEVDGLSDHPCVEIDREWPSSEDTFLVFGYPVEGGAVQLTPARLTYRATHGVAPTAYLDLASDTIKPGMSGAAVLNLRTGAVCGVVVASKHPAHPDGALAIPWSAIAADLSEVLDANRVFHLSSRRWDEASAGMPGHKGKFNVYLRALIDWLGRDPWPADLRFGGPVLTPDAIERKLRITAAGADQNRDFDADNLTGRCQRLVILGGPGSGKTWLAKRTARRCAEDALKALAAGKSVDEVELPLYTTCSSLFAAGGDVWEAAVTSALHQLGNLGGSHISAALVESFTKRNKQTVLVIDSLDEAHGSDLRLRQVDTLPWRIVLTSRPASWNNQLVIDEANPSHRIGELQPLRYPDDVESFIRSWYAGHPGWGNDLAGQIARRPDLQQTATVPLILALYCLLGGKEPLPDAKRDLYKRVLKRMLTGRWRGSDDNQPDVDTCLRALRAWAWAGATSHPISRVGTWADDIPTERAQLSAADQDAVDNVAAPLGFPDIDTGKILRRFVHRSIREYLVAEHVAMFPVDQAIEALLSQLWYDPDWEYAAPAAIAMSPERDQLLRGLICRAARSDYVPADLSVIDAGWEFRRLLARVASESSDADWPELAPLINRAREDLARSARVDDLSAARWATSNREARAALLGLLADETDSSEATELADGLVKLGATADDKSQALNSLVRLFRVEEYGREAVGLLRAIRQLAATAEEKKSVREALLGMLSDETKIWRTEWLVDCLVDLDPTAENQSHARAALLALLSAGPHESIVGSLVRLAPTTEDKRQAREALLRLFVSHTDSSASETIVGRFIQLDPTTEDKQQARDALLRRIGEINMGEWPAAQLLSMLVQLAPTQEERRQTRDAVLRLLDIQDIRSPANLADVFLQLEPTTGDKQQARAALQRLLSDGALTAEQFTDRLLQLDPTTDETQQARAALLRSLANERYGWFADSLVRKLIILDPTAEEIGQARGAVLRLLPTGSRSAARSLVDALLKLDPTTEEKQRARGSLLALLTAESDADEATGLARRLLQLDPAEVDMSQAREAMLRLLPRWQDGEVAEASVAMLALLTPTVHDKRQIRAVILGSLSATDDQGAATRLVQGLLQLGPTIEDKHQARHALCRLLEAATNERSLSWVVDLLTTLDLTEEERIQERSALLRVLANELDAYAAARLVNRLVMLELTGDATRAARELVLRSLAADKNGYAARELMGAFVHLNPDISHLSTWHAWAAPPTAELLIAARRNSTTTAWLTALPILSASSA